MAVSRALLEAFRRAGQTELSVRSAKSAARDARRLLRAGKPTTSPTSGTLGASAPHGALRKGKRVGTYYVSDSGEKVYI